MASFDFDPQRYCDIFNGCTQGAKRPIEIFKALNGDALTATATAAMQAGISSEIAEPTVPAGSCFWWLDPSVVS
jgi:hypothetical protein